MVQREREDCWSFKAGVVHRNEGNLYRSKLVWSTGIQTIHTIQSLCEPQECGQFIQFKAGVVHRNEDNPYHALLVVHRLWGDSMVFITGVVPKGKRKATTIQRWRLSIPEWFLQSLHPPPIIIIHSFYIALFSALEQTHCAHWHVILNE